MLNIANLKPGMVVSVRDPWTLYPRCLVVTTSNPNPEFKLGFVSLEGNYRIRPFFDDDVVEVVE